MPNPKMQKGQKDYANWVLIAIGLIILLVIGLWIKQKHYEAQEFDKLQKSQAQTPVQPLQPVPAEQTGVRPQPQLTPPAPLPQPIAQHNIQSTVPNNKDAFLQRIKAESQKTVASFKNLARLDFSLPGQFQFSPYDLQDGMASIFGYDDKNKTGVTALAYPKDATPKQALEFLKQSIEDMPNTNGAQITQVSPAKSLPEPKSDSGLLGGTMWKAKYSDGRDVYALFLRRQDKRGTYMFVYSGPPSYFQQNSGVLDSIYGQVRALPPEK